MYVKAIPHLEITQILRHDPSLGKLRGRGIHFDDQVEDAFVVVAGGGGVGAHHEFAVDFSGEKHVLAYRWVTRVW